jgi:hypothetical protein
MRSPQGGDGRGRDVATGGPAYFRAGRRGRRGGPPQWRPAPRRSGRQPTAPPPRTLRPAGREVYPCRAKAARQRLPARRYPAARRPLASPQPKAIHAQCRLNPPTHRTRRRPRRRWTRWKSRSRPTATRPTSPSPPTASRSCSDVHTARAMPERPPATPGARARLRLRSPPPLVLRPRRPSPPRARRPRRPSWRHGPLPSPPWRPPRRSARRHPPRRRRGRAQGQPQEPRL